MGLDRLRLAPAAVVGAGDGAAHLGVAVVVVAGGQAGRGGGLVVDVDLADPAVGVGVGPGQVLAVGSVEALGLELGDVGGEVAHGRGGDLGLGDHQVAGGVGHVADVADAARLGRAVPEDGVGVGRPGHEVGEEGRRAVGRAGQADVDELHPVAVAAGAVAGDAGLGRGHRRLGRGAGGGAELLAHPHVHPVGGGVGPVGAAHPAVAGTVRRSRRRRRRGRPPAGPARRRPGPGARPATPGRRAEVPLPGAAWLLGAEETSPPAKATKVTATTKRRRRVEVTHGRSPRVPTAGQNQASAPSAGNLDGPFDLAPHGSDVSSRAGSVL